MAAGFKGLYQSQKGPDRQVVVGARRRPWVVKWWLTGTEKNLGHSREGDQVRGVYGVAASGRGPGDYLNHVGSSGGPDRRGAEELAREGRKISGVKKQERMIGHEKKG